MRFVVRKPQLETPVRPAFEGVAEGEPATVGHIALGTFLLCQSYAVQLHIAREETRSVADTVCRSDQICPCPPCAREAIKLLVLSVPFKRELLIYSVVSLSRTSALHRASPLEPLRGRFDALGSGESWLEPWSPRNPRNSPRAVRRTSSLSHPSLRRKKLDASYGREGERCRCHAMPQLGFKRAADHLPLFKHVTRHTTRPCPHSASLNSIGSRKAH